MHVGPFDIQFIGHACFLFKSPEGAAIVTDPLFVEQYPEPHGGHQRFLSRPPFEPEAIRQCDAIFISHEHRDHFDPDAIERIQRKTGATVWAAAKIVDDLRERGGDPASHAILEEGIRFTVKDVMAAAYAGYDESFDALGRANKFSLLLECAGTRIFYCGDCHDAPPAMIGRPVDALFSWPHPSDEKLAAMGRDIPMKQYVLMHDGRFDPGGPTFWCNFDYKDHAPRVERLIPGTRAVIPEQVKSLR